jgi:uncharacterized protein (DUF1330 family)
VISAIAGIADEATVRRYAEPTGPAIERFVASNAEPVVAEGGSPSAPISMVEFPALEGAQSWHDSPEYAQARAITPASFKGRVLMSVEGVTVSVEGVTAKEAQGRSSAAVTAGAPARSGRGP